MGSVVVRRRAVGLVLGVAGDRLLLTPITRLTEPALAGDVVLDQLGDLVLAGCRDGAVVRVSMQVDVPADGQRLLGMLSGAAMCRVSRARMRLAAADVVHARWSGERAARQARRERPVKL